MRKYKPRADTAEGRDGKIWFSFFVLDVAIPEFVTIGSPECDQWLQVNDHFVYHVGDIFFSVKRYRRDRGNGYWTAYKQIRGYTQKFYIGSCTQVTTERLEEIGAEIHYLISHPGEK